LNIGNNAERPDFPRATLGMAESYRVLRQQMTIG